MIPLLFIATVIQCASLLLLAYAIHRETCARRRDMFETRRDLTRFRHEIYSRKNP